MGKNKRNISKLDNEYREKIADYAISKNLKCKNAILVLKATGCRPNELKNGVKVKLSDDLKNIEFTIIGSKLNSKMKRGIRMRKISVSLYKNNEFNEYLKPLIEDINTSENSMIRVSISSENAFSGYISKISKRLWPRKTYHASAYSFRHSFATDLKNSGVNNIEIAKSMGHASTRSQLSYGRKRRNSSGDVSPIASVDASSAPRDKSDRLLRFKIQNKNKKLSVKPISEVISSIEKRSGSVNMPESAPKKKGFKM
ncbi:site-specific integrase [Escherichia coli]|nr:site-specific integrase [Escherichia coli]